MDTEFYKSMLEEMRKRSMSIREFAKYVGISYASLIEFFDKKRIFRPMKNKNMAKIHNTLGIPYEVIEQYNETILKERGE